MKRPDLLETAVWALAAHRATRLVTADVITKPVRDRIVKGSYVRAGVYRWDEPGPVEGWSEHAEDDEDAPKLAVLVTCRWCASVWLVSGLMLAAYVFPRPARVLRFLLAGSSAAVLLARIEE